MLEPHITMNLDHLASIGVLDYDAAASIAGSAPRYVGNPPPLMPPNAYTPLDGKYFVPEQDTFNGKPLNPSSTPEWKKWAFGALTIATAFAVFPLLKYCKWSTVKNLCSSAWQGIKNLCSTGWNKFCGLFRRGGGTTPPAP